MRVRSGDGGGGISSEGLEVRVWFPGEADGAACEERCRGEKGEDELCCFMSGDVADEVEIEG